MEIEDKIIAEVEKSFKNIKDEEEKKIIKRINQLFVYQAVKITEKERELKDSENYIENKLFEIIK